VPGAPLSPLVMLCGSAFGLGIPGYQLRRHRWFEVSGAWMMSPPCQHHGPVIGIYGDHGRDRRRKGGYGRYFTLDERKQAMGVDWMARDELDQAIPPAYTEYIGRALLDAVQAQTTTPAASLSLLGRCPVCRQPVPGMASARYAHLVRLDIHLHPVVAGWCVGSRSCGDYWVRREYPKAGEAS
jgi:hypothetical protein